MNFADLALAACMVLAAAGAVWDIASRRIPNWLCLLLAAASLGYAWSAGGTDAMLWGAAHALVALVVGMGLFALGVIGGGDAKFYSAAAFAIPLYQGLPFLGWTSVAGLVLLIVLVVGNRVFAKVRKPMSELRRMEVPYGVAIASGFALAFFALSGPEPTPSSPLSEPYGPPVGAHALAI